MEDISNFSPFATHVLQPNDPRISEFKYAIRDEAVGIYKRAVFQLGVIPQHSRKGVHILRSRYVNAIQNVGTPEQKHMSRLVVQAVKRSDRDSPNLFKYSLTTTQSSTRILLSTAASYDWELRTRDISKAFVSSDYDLLREVFILPSKEANRLKEALWRLLKPLYVMPESSLLWYATYSGHLCSLVLISCDPVDPCLFLDMLMALLLLQTLRSLCRFMTLSLPVLHLSSKKKEAQAHRFPTKPFSTIASKPVQSNATFLSKTETEFKFSQSTYVNAI